MKLYIFLLKFFSLFLILIPLFIIIILYCFLKPTFDDIISTISVIGLFLSISITLFVVFMEKDIKYNTIVELINEELDYNISKIKSLEEFIKKDKNDLPNNLSDASIRASYFYQFIKLNNWTNYKVDLRTYEKNDFYYYLKYYDYMEKLLNEANKIKNFDKTKEPEKFIYFYEKSFSDLYSEFFDELKKGGLV